MANPLTTPPQHWGVHRSETPAGVNSIVAMANALLDFVMSLLRDPDAAARYTADSAQALADAGLTGVTDADVQNLIPVVAESLSMAAPSHSLGVFGAESAGNVWASGAATAAFDAFADHLPEPVAADVYAAVIDVPDGPGPEAPPTTVPNALPNTVPGADLLDDVRSPQLDELAVLDHVATESGIADDWISPAADPQPGEYTPGFDIFD